MKNEIIIEDDMDISDVVWNYKTPIFSIGEKVFLEKYLFEEILDELATQYYWMEDPEEIENLDMKIDIIRELRKLLSPLDIIAIDSSIGGSDLVYGGYSAMRSVLRMTYHFERFTAFDIDDIDSFRKRISMIPGNLFDELIQILDDSKIMRSIWRGHLYKYRLRNADREAEIQMKLKCC